MLVLLLLNISRTSAAESAFPPLLSSKLDTLYATAYDETIGKHVVKQRDGTTYVSDRRYPRGNGCATRARSCGRTSVSRVHDADVANSLRGVVERQGALYPDRSVCERLFRTTIASSRRSSRSIRSSIRSGSPRTTTGKRTDASIFTPTVRRAFLRRLARVARRASITICARTIATTSSRGAAAAARFATPGWSGRDSAPPTIRCAITTTFR